MVPEGADSARTPLAARALWAGEASGPPAGMTQWAGRNAVGLDRTSGSRQPACEVTWTGTVRPRGRWPMPGEMSSLDKLWPVQAVGQSGHQGAPQACRLDTGRDRWQGRA